MIPLQLAVSGLLIGAPKAKQSFDSLFGNTIPFKDEIHLCLYAFPGVVVALIIGVTINVALEWVVSKLNDQASKSRYWALIGLGVTLHLIFATPFVYYVAGHSQWYKIIPPPPNLGKKNQGGKKSKKQSVVVPHPGRTGVDPFRERVVPDLVMNPEGVPSENRLDPDERRPYPVREDDQRWRDASGLRGSRKSYRGTSQSGADLPGVLHSG